MPSDRGELEITDVNNYYIERGEMTWAELDGWWTDAGTFESLQRASNMVAETGANKLTEHSMYQSYEYNRSNDTIHRRSRSRRRRLSAEEIL